MKVKCSDRMSRKELNKYFRDFCATGELSFAKQLLHEHAAVIDVCSQDNLAFQKACAKGHMAVAKWLFELKPDLDISAGDDSAFRHACFGNHLHIAQWIISGNPKVNISARRDQVFRWACLTENYEMLKWLDSIRPFYFKIKIREKALHRIHGTTNLAKHVRWKTRNYALCLRNRHDCNNYVNVFYDVPEDVSRYIVQMFL